MFVYFEKKIANKISSNEIIAEFDLLANYRSKFNDKRKNININMLFIVTFIKLNSEELYYLVFHRLYFIKNIYMILSCVP